MKKLTFILISFWLIFASCKKLGNDQNVTQRSVSTSPPVATAQATCGQTQTQTLLAGQSIHAGTISISNDQTNVYVNYSTSGGWQIQKTHLYVGTCSLIPTSHGGNPQIGLFPYQTSYSPAVTAFTYTIPLAGLGSCYCVAAHCEVVLKDSNGNIIQTETGWARETRLEVTVGQW